MRSVHAVEYYSPPKKNLVPIQATIQVNREDKRRGVGNESPHIVRSLLCETSRTGRSAGGKEAGGCQAWGGRKGEGQPMGTVLLRW